MTQPILFLPKTLKNKILSQSAVANTSPYDIVAALKGAEPFF